MSAQCKLRGLEDDRARRVDTRVRRGFEGVRETRGLEDDPTRRLGVPALLPGVQSLPFGPAG